MNKQYQRRKKSKAKPCTLEDAARTVSEVIQLIRHAQTTR
jgi:hypothetical protein